MMKASARRLLGVCAAVSLLGLAQGCGESSGPTPPPPKAAGDVVKAPPPPKGNPNNQGSNAASDSTLRNK